MKLREILSRELNQEELSQVPSSFDVIGSKEKSVAVVEIPEELEHRKKLIAQAIMKQHKNVKSVLKKGSARKGTHRIREYELIAGDKDTEVRHKESGCTFLVDPKNVYFSPRESTERERIASMVKKGEIVMVFFAGMGPFNIVISKHAQPEETIGIEINHKAIEYFTENLKINKITNCRVVEGDVADSAKEFYNKCDRVIMPLPETGYQYLDAAVNCLKENGVCHFYCFCQENDIESWTKKIKTAAPKAKVLSYQKVLPYGPGIWKMRIDFSV